jgi:hypothetical protein
MTTGQAGLHGHLQKVRDIGLPLVSLTSGDLDHPDVSTIAPHHGTTRATSSDQAPTGRCCSPACWS